MKKSVPIILLLTLSPLLAGCASGPYARQGATIGALVGTPVGALIGSRNGETGAGALLGGTIGALTGSNLGAEVDAERQALLANQNRNGRSLSIPDVINMTRNGLSENVIITQVQTQGINQSLSPNDLVALKQSGVSDRVIQQMQNASQFTPASGLQPAAPVIVEEHYWGPGFYHRPPAPVQYQYHRHHRPGRPRARSSISFSHRF